MKIYKLTALLQNPICGKRPGIAILVLFSCYVAYSFIGISGYVLLHCEIV